MGNIIKLLLRVKKDGSPDTRWIDMDSSHLAQLSRRRHNSAGVFRDIYVDGSSAFGVLKTKFPCFISHISDYWICDKAIRNFFTDFNGNRKIRLQRCRTYWEIFFETWVFRFSNKSAWWALKCLKALRVWRPLYILFFESWEKVPKSCIRPCKLKRD